MLAKRIISKGGRLVPLILEPSITKGTGITNPSILKFGDKLLVNIRRVNYSLYHCHNFPHKFGPLQYIHTEDKAELATFNILAELNEDLDIVEACELDFSAFNSEPKWTFTGLEDVRLVDWEDKLLATGVRRDVKPDGQGRMELSEIENGKEISRLRIDSPTDAYCEKNWMPVLDQPYTYVKWTNPTELTKIDKHLGTIVKTQVVNSQQELPRDLRGGSQVIPIEDGYLAITHEVAFYYNELGQKDAIYRHRFVKWNKDFTEVKFSSMFDFLGAKIEFCCGLAEYGNSYIISFGRQDSTAYLLVMPKNLLGAFF